MRFLLFFPILLGLVNAKENIVSELNPENISLELNRIETVITSSIDTYLKVSKKDRNLLKILSVKSPVSPKKKKKQIQEDNIDSFVKKIAEKKKEPEEILSTLDIKTAFSETVDVNTTHHSPIHIKSSTFLFSNGISPKKTPRRSKNISRLLKGKPPICVSTTTNEQISCDFHHLNQQNDDLIVQIPKDLHKKYHGFLHQNLKEPSSIDRSRFNRHKDRACRIQGIRMLKKMIATNQEIKIDELLQELAPSTGSEDELF